MIWLAAWDVLAVTIALVVLHLLGVETVRRGWFPEGMGGATAILIPLMSLGLAALRRALSAQAIPTPLAIGAIGLYLSACITYIQIRSVLSRGYSLRILVDLLERGGSADLETLKTQYASGAGLSWMVNKRLRTLTSLHLVERRDDRVGPLTATGRALAMVSDALRRLLRLDLVG